MDAAYSCVISILAALVFAASRTPQPQLIERFISEPEVRLDEVLAKKREKLSRIKFSDEGPGGRPHDWGVIPADDEVGDPYTLLASMRNTTTVFGGEMDPGEEALLDMYNRVNLILYRGQKKKYRAAVKLASGLDDAIERFSAEKYSDYAPEGVTYEKFVEAEIKNIVRESCADVINVGRWITDETLDEMRAFRAMQIDGKPIEHFGFWSTIGDGFKTIGNGIKDGFNWLKDKAEGIIKKIGEEFRDIIDDLGDLADDVLDAFNAITDKILDPIKDAFKKMVDTIILGPINWIKDTAQKIWDKIKDLEENIRRKIVDAFEAIKNKIIEVVNNVKTGLERTMQNVKDGITHAVDVVKDKLEAFANGFVDFFKTIFEGFKTFFGWIGDAFRACWNGIKWAFWHVVNGLKTAFYTVFNGLKWAFWHVIDGLKGVWFWVKDKILKIAPWILNIFSDILQFFKNLFLAGKFIALTAAEIIENPFQGILKIMLLLAGIALGIALFLIYIVLSMGPAIIIGFVYAWVAAVAIAIIETVLYVLVSWIATFSFVIVWIFNVILQGGLTFLLRCENDADSWFTRPGFAQRNGFKRFIFCFRPCSAGWLRKSGVFCVNQQQSCPVYCPQQQIYGFFNDPKQRAKLQPYIFDRHIPDSSFNTTSAMNKRGVLLKTLATKKEFLGQCSQGMASFDFINRHVCSNVNVLDPAKFDDETKAKMRSLCKQAYCDYAIEKAANGAPVARLAGVNPYTWCSALGDGGPGNQVRGADDPIKEFLICIYLLIMGTVISFVTMTLKNYMSVNAVEVF